MKILVTPQQSAFIPETQIQGCIDMAYECVHHIKHKSKGSTTKMTLKLDLNKAFDRVEWDFLLAVMDKMGSILSG